MFPCGWRFHCMSGESIAQSVKNLPAMQETQVRFLGWEDPLEKEMATHSSILAWKIPWTEEPSGLLSMDSQELDTTSWLNHHCHRWKLIFKMTCSLSNFPYLRKKKKNWKDRGFRISNSPIALTVVHSGFLYAHYFIFVVQSLSRVRLFVTPWRAAHQACLSATISWSLLKLMSTEAVMPSNHLVLSCCFSSQLQSFLASGSFPMSQFFTSCGQSIGASASVSVLSMNIQVWFPLGLAGLSSLQ